MGAWRIEQAGLSRQAAPRLSRRRCRWFLSLSLAWRRPLDRWAGAPSTAPLFTSLVFIVFFCRRLLRCCCCLSFSHTPSLPVSCCLCLSLPFSHPRSFSFSRSFSHNVPFLPPSLPASPFPPCSLLPHHQPAAGPFPRRESKPTRRCAGGPRCRPCPPPMLGLGSACHWKKSAQADSCSTWSRIQSRVV